MLSIIAAVLVFGLIVMIHEFGHFLFAKLNGIRVLEFSIGMGPRIFSFTRGDTKYSLKILPLGGSCMMLGEDEGDIDERSFNHKSVWSRISVIFAGPLFNFILAYVLAVIILLNIGYMPLEIGGVMDGYPAQEAGLQAGDRITKINGKKMHIYGDIQLTLAFNRGDDIRIEYEREGGDGPSSAIIKPEYSKDTGSYLIGIQSSGYHKTGSFSELLFYSFQDVRYCIVSVIKSLGFLISGKASVNDVAGPVKIMGIIDETVTSSIIYGIRNMLLSLALLCELLSANLGVMNLLPIPALDGGRLVFLFVEALRGKPIDKEKEGMVHLAGMVVLMIFMIFVIFNDIRGMF